MIIDDFRDAMNKELATDPRPICGVRMNSKMINKIHKWAKLTVNNGGLGQGGLHGSLFGITIFLGINSGFEFLHTDDLRETTPEEMYRFIYQVGIRGRKVHYEGNIS